MKKKQSNKWLMVIGFMILNQHSNAQIKIQKDYSNNYSPTIGTFQGIKYREGGFSGLFPIPNTNGKEFWTISDRGFNVDCSNANLSGCRPTYDKIFGFPSYSPKIHRVRVQGDSVQILQSIAIKRPNGTGATGILNPTGFGSTAAELASTDTVNNCTNFLTKTASKDVWALDCEAIVVDKDGNFWVGEENGSTIWKINQNGVVINRYSPYANLVGAQPEDLQIDTCFKYRRNNRGFENLTITPSGKIYALIQSPMYYPTSAVGQASRIHRIIEIDPITSKQKMYAYVNDGLVGTAGSNQIRLQDWKCGDMAAINDTTFLVLEAAARGTTDIKRMYKISLNGATEVKSGFSYSTKTLEGLSDSAGLASAGIVPVKKTLFMDLLANGWPSSYDKAEGLAIVNDSTIAICNDNDYGQTCPNADGIAIPTSTTCHIVVFDLKGKNKLVNFIRNKQLLIGGLTGPNSNISPYLIPTGDGVTHTSILSAGETAANGYKMVGVPDGAGAFDNNDGTFTLLVNHEITNAQGIVRAHGSNGAFVSKWIIKKSDLSVLSGQDLMQNVYLWTPTGYIVANKSNVNSKAAFSRFCSADLPAVTAFYNPITGLGTKERIFMNGEETGSEGRAIAHIVTGNSAGSSYELPMLGKFSIENYVANPNPSNKTILIGMDDATPGQVYVYIGTKNLNGNDIEKAGLTNGKLYGVAVSGLTTEVSASFPNPNTAFTLIDLGTIRDSSGTALDKLSVSKGITNFLRPEDGTWDPYNPTDFYFNTTNAFSAPSRLWQLRFTDINNPEKGGNITALLDGTEGHKMLDNIGIDNSGHLLLQEDVGNNAWNGRILQYTIATDQLIPISKHDPNRFESGGSNFITIDEETSGIIDVQSILGPGMFITVDQAHNSITGEVVEGGQILTLFNPKTFESNPEISMIGNSTEIASGDTTPLSVDNTNFGASSISNNVTKSFTIKNTGIGNLTVSNLQVLGIDASNFSIISPPTFPLTISPNSVYNFVVKFSPSASGPKKATVVVNSNDYDESRYEFRVVGLGFSPGSSGPSSSNSPYLIGTSPGVTFTSILTTGDIINNYSMVGIPDGLGAFDNNDGTFTLVVNHELNNYVGSTRAHGSLGAFISRWNINKSNLSVISGQDQIKNVYLWNGSSYSLYNSSNASNKAAFGRFCSADLATPSAFYNAKSGKGSNARIFLNGEEIGTEGRAFAHILTGLENGNTYELPNLGKFSWENAVANPFEQDKTIVVGTDDATPGQVYVYIGQKSKTGTEIDKAGLTNGKLYGVSVNGMANEINASIPAANTSFTLVDLGIVKDSTGFQLNRFSNAKNVTNFLRPEDGSWDPNNFTDFYFNTTNAITSPSRVWQLKFTDITNPEKGGVISAVLDGTEGQKMLDNMTVDNSGHILLQEDVGNNSHNGRILQYTIATDKLEVLAQHDPSRFETAGSNFLTIDEESSGIIDVQSILGPGMFLTTVQAHNALTPELVEGGQLLVMYNPTTFSSNPELAILGKGTDITNNSSNTLVSNGTNFGNVGSNYIGKSQFSISNKGKGDLIIKSIKFSNDSLFSLKSVNLPFTVKADSFKIIEVQFISQKLGSYNSKIMVLSNDIDESIFEFSLSANVVGPEISVNNLGNSILNNDFSAGLSNGTDFGQVSVNKSIRRTFTVKNDGLSRLKISAMDILGSSNFKISNITLPATIDTQSSFSFIVTYTGISPMLENATLKISSNAISVDSTYQFGISAECIAAQLSIFGNNNPILNGDMNPNKFNQTDFGLVGIGYQRLGVYQLENNGKEYLFIDSIVLAGANSNFKIYYPTNVKFAIKPGKTENLMIEFGTADFGVKKATVNIYSNNYNVPKFTFGISAEGTTPSSTQDVVSDDIHIYPVPTRGVLNISSDNVNIQSVSIYNASGSLIKSLINQNSIDSRHIQLNTTSFSDGVYFIEINTAGTLIRKKFSILN